MQPTLRPENTYCERSLSCGTYDPVASRDQASAPVAWAFGASTHFTVWPSTSTVRLR